MNKVDFKQKYSSVLASTKQGLRDIKAVCEEGKFKLFLKQAIVVTLLIFGFRHFSQSLDKKDQQILGQISAVDAQQSNEQEYVAGKKKLLELEPRFPDLSSKNAWLLAQVAKVFGAAQLEPKIGSQSEDSNNSNYTVASVPVDVSASFADLGRLLADVESRDEYLRISEFTLTKSNESLGKNTIHFKVNTVFPKEKLASVLFKDANKKDAGKKKEARKK